MSSRPAPNPGQSTAATAALQKRVWAGSLPLEIRLSAADCRTYDDSEPYLISVPRLSYLPFLLPRLHAFFAHALIDPSAVAAHEAWLSFDGLPLKWHYPVGLLHDLFSGASPAGLSSDDALGGAATSSSSTGTLRAGTLAAGDERDDKLPWRLTVHYAAYPADLLFPLDAGERVLHDAFINAVKEADFVRNGSAKTVMSLSRLDSDSLWRSVREHDLPLFEAVNTKLWSAPGVGVRNVPLKIYLPTAAAQGPEGQAGDDERAREEDAGEDGKEQQAPRPGSVRVVQGLVSPYIGAAGSSTGGGRQLTTLGSALNLLLPAVFPSRRNPVLAVPVLHGAVVPMAALLAELGRAASYADGFLHIVVVLLS